jgi:hypothetical protein
MQKFALGFVLAALVCLPVTATPPHPATAVIGDMHCQLKRVGGVWFMRFVAYEVNDSTNSAIYSATGPGISTPRDANNAEIPLSAAELTGTLQAYLDTCGSQAESDEGL